MDPYYYCGLGGCVRLGANCVLVIKHILHITSIVKYQTIFYYYVSNVFMAEFEAHI